MDAWCKILAPSGDLRRWFNHDPAKWKESNDGTGPSFRQFCSLPTLLDAAKQGNITLLHSALDTEHNSAIALKSYLEERLKS